ncbi:Sip1-related alpha-galactosidase [Metabacillus hrfriensis]|uniref:Sip1-related alpha-galactosidase n=1 Tax=Metabacillus hrfriensis TaxID=3048891 RepID=A0ACD4R6F0_9BACI|nr:Sip1-related alpha-galactosidase [Metabacillus sp. CT-WN-B3]WHZ56047.1 Sip1-related alpha-galactosidase [Metabacillus sp. CT-WN-B3]
MQIANYKQSIDLKMLQETIFEDINVSVKLTNKEIENLPLKHSVINDGNEELFSEYYFADEKDEVLLSLSFKMEDEILLATVKAEVKNGRIQNRHHYFAPEDCITIKIGNLPGMEGLLGHYQHKDWWTRPCFNTDFKQLPARTQSLLWKTEKSFYYLLPVVDKDYRTELSGNGSALAITLSSYKGGFDQCETLSFVLGASKDPFSLAKQTVQKGIECLGYPTLRREYKRYPKVLDFLGWCSWDAFYQNVNETGLNEKMGELHEKKLPVKWIMIDDGWLTIEENRLTSFEADLEKFPETLRNTTEMLKGKYNVNWVGVWHTIAGYWGGVHPDSQLAKEMEQYLYRTSSGKLVPYPVTEKGFGFWNAWHARLKQQGIDFVKVDSQSAVNNFLMYQESIGESARAAHMALEASAGIHFDQCVINCMGMSAENIWNRPISSVSRNSDDFVPGEEISFKEHALQNAYNSYYHSQFYWGDWDMFWTEHDEGVQNSVLRAVSGGPIYFSDRVGETDAEKLWPLIFKDGKILRGDQPGLPTADCLFNDPNKETVPLKIWNKAGNAGIIATFNVHLEGKEVKGFISPSNVVGLMGETFLIYDYFNQKTIIMKQNDSLEFNLEKEAVSLFIVVPIKGNVTPLGLINKYLVPKTISEQYFFDKKTVISLREGGEFAFFTKDSVQVFINGKETIAKELDENLFILDCTPMDEILIEIIES